MAVFNNKQEKMYFLKYKRIEYRLQRKTKMYKHVFMKNIEIYNLEKSTFPYHIFFKKTKKVLGMKINHISFK
jgi:hypothetical protein